MACLPEPQFRSGNDFPKGVDDSFVRPNSCETFFATV